MQNNSIKPTLYENLKNNLYNINPHNFINHHLMDDHKSLLYKAFLSFFIIMFGTFVASSHTPYLIADVLLEAIGFVIHGIGCIPLVDYLINLKENNKL